MGRPGYLSHNDEHLPAGGPKVEMQKQMVCFCPFVIYLSRSFSMCLSPMQASLFVSPIIRMYSSFLRWVSGWRPPPLLSVSAAVNASRHAVRVVTEPLICADGAWKDLLRSDCLVLQHGGCVRLQGEVTNKSVPLNQERCVWATPPPPSLWLGMCVFIPCRTPPPCRTRDCHQSHCVPAGFQPFSPLFTLVSPPHLPPLFFPPAYSNSWRGHMAWPIYLSPSPATNVPPHLLLCDIQATHTQKNNDQTKWVLNSEQWQWQ